ncbi:NmrA family NAD(P)-binding protein [Rhizobium pusense]|uniref:Nucleoside-diphosphate sugar epimerase n=1 Tax=Agrobacterium genomosp. 2 str. CFBP 5494 TaxID=1183436 RepID=A0A9W5B4H1_9HYPH|nr:MULTISPECIES: NmrA family NAD(P)-binding protein [Rhizobium/Agrobacterium group]MDH0912781.1 NmrA family NAD(P)-binding protein [Agrobacterium pusense]MDH1099049.1 NmrA family NAD(P)-binding protein [Agrobacterium pusense]MDH1115596.1 NmrA family NAD(P)-binding protein [Agrobacterium pusense]MDH2197366.1 NmrA family NAD(P)-binding protein [Agrobacterium pusense]OJH55780.1 nucleoside-diphosphate sugar epimerase [Agrobacterium pusense]
MRIAVVGATGRIGARLTENLLAKGHSVKALSRGGPALNALVAKGAEPFFGSFDTGDGELGRFFDDADAAFLMVKTLWAAEDFHGHYPAVALRFFDALRDSPVKLAVSLTAMGSELSGNTGHFQGFHMLDQILNRLRDINLVHLQGGWFMQDLARRSDAIVRHNRIGWTLAPDVKAPWVSIQDIADFAANEFDAPTGEHRSVKQLGIDYTMAEIAAIIGRAVGREVDYRFVDMRDREVETVFRERFGTLDRWVYDKNTAAALNDGRVKFRDDRPALPTTIDAFTRDTLKPLIEKARTDGVKPETFLTWSSQR